MWKRCPLKSGDNLSVSRLSYMPFEMLFYIWTSISLPVIKDGQNGDDPNSHF